MIFLPTTIMIIESDDDKEFMTRLFLDNRYIMFSEIKKLVDDSFVAEDIIQDAIVRLIDKIPLLKALEKRKQINYVITTVKNLTRNYLRKKSTRNMASFEEQNPNMQDSQNESSRNIEAFLINREQLLDLSKIWSELSDANRELLERKYILDQSDEEIAKVFEIKPISVRMKMTRARREALTLLQEEKIK